MKYLAAFAIIAFLCAFAIGLTRFALLWSKHQEDRSPEIGCVGGECTCAGTRHKNDTIYKYVCECCPSSGCKPNADLDLTPPKKAKA